MKTLEKPLLFILITFLLGSCAIHAPVGFQDKMDRTLLTMELLKTEITWWPANVKKGDFQNLDNKLNTMQEAINKEKSTYRFWTPKFHFAGTDVFTFEIPETKDGFLRQSKFYYPVVKSDNQKYFFECKIRSEKTSLKMIADRLESMLSQGGYITNQDKHLRYFPSSKNSFKILTDFEVVNEQGQQAENRWYNSESVDKGADQLYRSFLILVNESHDRIDDKGKSPFKLLKDFDKLSKNGLQEMPKEIGNQKLNLEDFKSHPFISIQLYVIEYMKPAGAPFARPKESIVKEIMYIDERLTDPDIFHHLYSANLLESLVDLKNNGI